MMAAMQDSPLALLLSLALLGGVAGAAEPQTSREQLHAALWMQRADEYRALVEQTWRLAGERLDAALQPGTAALEQMNLPAATLVALPTAVVVDLDETVLDNTFYQARLIQDRREYTEESWRAWMLEARAPALPGAVEFLKRAARAGHRIFYVTNRLCSRAASPAEGPCPEEIATRRNLLALGLPGADALDNLLLRGERAEWLAGGKSLRRAWLGERYRIIMEAGDDLRDFVDRPVFAARRAELAPLFGTRWFLLPNPLYGSWERAISDPACDAGTPAGDCSQLRLERKYALLDTDPLPLTLEPRSDWDPSRKRLRLATWNIEYLLTPDTYAALAPGCVNDGGRVPASERAIPCSIVPRLERRAEDFAVLRRYASKIDGDVIALQEVDGADTARLVFPGYEFCFSARPNVQKNGFAIRRGLPFRCEPEYLPLSLGDSVRRGIVVTLFPQSADEMTLLAVHLKSGCPAGPLTDGGNAACVTLAAQAGPLEAWIDGQATAGRRFGLLGDFNRRLALDGRQARDAAGRLVNLWPEINDADPPAAALLDVTRGARFIKCVDNDPYSDYIDTVLLGRELAKLRAGSSLIRVPYSRADYEAHRLSDHCPVGTELTLH